MKSPTEAGIGHNNPPEPVDEICAAYETDRSEAESWLDGQRVENADQMKAVDALRTAMRECRLELERGQKSATAPLHDAYKSEIARWKPSIDDHKAIEKGLVTLVDGFKQQLAAEQREAERQAAIEAARKRQEAEAAAKSADEANIDTQRQAQQLAKEAAQAEAVLRDARQDRVRGLRKVTRYEITDHRAALHWIARSDRDAVTAFVEEYVRKHHKAATIDGVRVWQDEEAF